jgi:hypothetical protein
MLLLSGFETSSVRGPSGVGFCPPTSHRKMEVEQTYEKLWFKITRTMDKVQQNSNTQFVAS